MILKNIQLTKGLNAFLFILLIIFSCTDSSNYQGEIKPKAIDLVRNDKLSETLSYDAFGTLIKMRDLYIYVYRQGESHASDRGRCVYRVSSDTYMWSEQELLFEDGEYDCRNVHGGLVSDNEMVIFFNKYDFGSRESKGVFYIRGKLDSLGAITWSQPNSIEDRTTVYGRIVKLRDGRLMIGMAKHNSLENVEVYLHFSSDYGNTWSESIKVTGTLENGNTPCEEIYFDQGQGDMIFGVGRNDGVPGKPLLLYFSRDNGITWNVFDSNIQYDGWKLVSPWVEKISNQFIVLSVGARLFEDNQKGRIYTFLCDLDDLMVNAGNCYYEMVIHDTDSVDIGYPNIIIENENKIYGVFYSSMNADGVDLYQFGGYLQN